MASLWAVKSFFECHFDKLEEEKIVEIFGVKTFEEFDIIKAVEKLDYFSFTFSTENNEMTFFMDYLISEEDADEVLFVHMNEKLNILHFGRATSLKYNRGIKIKGLRRIYAEALRKDPD